MQQALEMQRCTGQSLQEYWFPFPVNKYLPSIAQESLTFTHMCTHSYIYRPTYTHIVLWPGEQSFLELPVPVEPIFPPEIPLP